jgi:DNA-binding response OmpR family regulator
MVFLVDDDIDDVEFVQEAFHKNNYEGELAVAPNGQVLMRQLTDSIQKKPGLILLDLNMPVKSGFDALQEIKGHPSLKSIPVIILTSSTSKADEMRCFELGCTLFFRKPTSIDEYNALARLIINVLNNAQRN